jgi:hypothetical protein
MTHTWSGRQESLLNRSGSESFGGGLYHPTEGRKREFEAGLSITATWTTCWFAGLVSPFPFAFRSLLFAFALRPLHLPVSPVQWTAHPSSTSIQDMRINHRGSDVLVAEQFLHRANVITRFQHVRGKAIAQAVTGGVLLNAGFRDRFFNGPLYV